LDKVLISEHVKPISNVILKIITKIKNNYYWYENNIYKILIIIINENRILLIRKIILIKNIKIIKL